MAAIRRGHSPLRVDLPQNSSSLDVPPISALFLIYFDIKAGYTIGWKRAAQGIELEGVVEYKSLPSGLHTVKEDLIYFIHEKYAGVSAFVNAPAEEESRNARMIAVGVLVPLDYGRLGRSWKHADALQNMAQELVKDPSKTTPLEEYWQSHKQNQGTTSINTESSTASSSPMQYQPIRRQGGKKGHSRNRSASDGAALVPAGHTLSSHHPAWSLSELLELFGPLTFPLYRAALLRKRILFVGHAPVQQTCDFVYGLSVLSNIPLAVSDLIEPSAPSQRLRPLFNIGVHDIPYLEEDLRASNSPTPDIDEDGIEPMGSGWIASTTDGILAMKNRLYDVLITIPPSYSSEAHTKVWPEVTLSDGTSLRATQRDLRRYRRLKWGLTRQGQSPPQSARPSSEYEQVVSGTFPKTSTVEDSYSIDVGDTDSISEPTSWSALAYSGFMWWASAGERQYAEDDEFEHDNSLLADFDSMELHTPHSAPKSTQEGNQMPEPPMAIIAYFHRFTTLILSTISDIVDATDSDDEENAPLRTEEGPTIYIHSDDVSRMGLDVWSATDQKFIVEIVKAYFGRDAIVEGMNVDVCGVRIC